MRSGGYGMLMGHQATKRRAQPSSPRRSKTTRADFIAQPVVAAERSTPACATARTASRRRSKADASTFGRTFCMARKSIVMPGGLTRVALRKGSRWSSTAARAGAARIHGCWRTKRKMRPLPMVRRPLWKTKPQTVLNGLAYVDSSEQRTMDQLDNGPAVHHHTASQLTRPMLARDADSMYWMTRYVERAEHVARMHVGQQQPAD